MGKWREGAIERVEAWEGSTGSTGTERGMADALGSPGVLGFEVRPGNVPGSWIATALLFGTAPIETDVVSGILGLGRFEMSLSVEFIEGLVPSVGELVGP
jgi:hypothetical protein